MSQLNGSKSVNYNEVINPNTLKEFLPDGGIEDANISDYSILASNIALSMVTKNKNIDLDDGLKIYQKYTDGKNNALDLSTNLIGSEQALKLNLDKDYKLVSKTSKLQQSSKEVTKFFSAHISGAIAGSGAAVISGPAGAVTVDFFVGNKVSSKVDGIWDNTVGPNICIMKNPITNDAVFLSSGKVDSVLKHHFTNEDKNQSISELKETNDSYTVIAQSDTGMIEYNYERSENAYTFTQGATEENIKEFLKYVPLKENEKLFFNINGEKYQLIENYLNKENKAISLDYLKNSEDKYTMYAVLNNIAFLTDKDESSIQKASDNGLLNPENYSQKFLEDKLERFNTLVKYDMYPSIQSSNINFAEDISDDNRHIKIDDAKYYEEDKGKFISSFGKISEDTIYGSLKNDIITTGNQNDYLEGNKGNDYLNGGRGDDIYYYKLGDGKDIIYEGASPINKYGSGNDTIEFHNNITPDMLTFTKKDNDLIINIQDTSNLQNNGNIIIKDWDNERTQIENFVFNTNDNKSIEYNINDVKEVLQKQENSFDEKLDNFESFGIKFIENTNKEEEVKEFKKTLENIKEIKNLDDKIKALNNLDLNTIISNEYAKDILNNKKNDIIENHYESLNSVKNTEYENSYMYLQSNTIQNNSTQSMN